MSDDRLTNATCHNCGKKMKADDTYYYCDCGFKIQIAFPWKAIWNGIKDRK